MKKISLIIAVALISLFSVNAQKIGYLKMETVLAQVPEYTAAQSQIETLSQTYSDIITKEYDKIETKFKNYQLNKAKLSQSQRDAIENEIINDEKALKELQDSYFGEEGEITKKGKEIMDPIMERIQKQIDSFAQANGYSLLIDLGSLPGVVYSKTEEDLSLKIVEIINKK